MLIRMSNTTTGFFQKNVAKGSRVVRITANDINGPFTSRLFVNGGESATLVVEKTKSLATAEKQAARMLNA